MPQYAALFRLGDVAANAMAVHSFCVPFLCFLMLGWLIFQMVSLAGQGRHLEFGMLSHEAAPIGMIQAYLTLTVRLALGVNLGAVSVNNMSQ